MISFKNILKRSNYVFLFLTSIIIFALILIPTEISFIKTISVLSRYNTTRVVPFITLLLWYSLSMKNQKLSFFISFLLVYSLFALVLNGLWSGAYTENNVIAGLIPRTDAFSYYGGSISYMESGYLTGYAKRRPIFGTFLAFILWLAKGNLQISLAIIAYLLATATFFSLIEVREALNPLAATLYFVVILLFARRFIGITLSENMGLLLGIIAFSFFLVFRRKSQKFQQNVFYFFIAIFIFALSQASRPGAIVTLPLLIVFSGLFFRKKEGFSWKMAFKTTVIIVVAFLLNSIIFKLTTLPGGTQINNIFYGLYGLVVGGKGWEQIFIDHPELSQLKSGFYEKEILRIIWQEIIIHPDNIIRGLIVQFRILFSFQSTNSIFSFAWANNKIFNYGLISIFFFLSCIGTAFIFIDPKNEGNHLFIVFILGFLFSLPFAPAYQTQYMRVYAATIPLLGFLPAYGLSRILPYLPKRLYKLFSIERKFETDTSYFMLIFSLILLLIIFLGPFVIKIFSPSQLYFNTFCEKDEDEAIFKYYPGTSIYLYKNDPQIMTWVPNITQLDYKGSIHSICCEDEIAYFENIHAPNVIYPALNLLTHNLIYMIVDKNLLPSRYGLIQVCGHIENVHGENSSSGFLYPNSIQPLQ